MNTYVQTVATITNPDGDTITVNGPTVQDWAPLDAAWKRAYRPIVLEEAAYQGLALPGRGVTVRWAKIDPA